MNTKHQSKPNCKVSAFVFLIVMMMYIRLFYWTYLDTVESVEDDHPPTGESTEENVTSGKLNERCDEDYLCSI